MRTNIEIDDKLMSQAMRSSGETTKKGTVEAALRMLVQISSQSSVRKLRRKIHWEGDLEASRLNRFPGR